MEPTYLTREDDDLIALVGCSLDRSPKSNWVEDSGGLPTYICRIARAIHRSGKSIQNSIQIAVSRVKRWAAGLDDVNADTRAKAAKAVAEWEALKAKNKVKKGAKRAAGRGGGRGGARGGRDTRVDLANVLLAAGPLQSKLVSDLDVVVRLAAGKGDPKKPYGNVTYADPGYKGGRKRYPIDSEAHVRAAWSYINQSGNQSGYTSEQVAAIKAKIRAAAKRFGIQISGD